MIETVPIGIELLNTVLPKQLDLVICSASFEDRCQILIEALNTQIVCKRILVSYISDEYEDINKRGQDLVNKLPNSEGLKLLANRPVKNTIAINETLNRLLDGSVENIFLDITTFTHEILLIIFKLIQEKQRKYKNFFIGYIGAKEYSINEPNLENKWLSSGISKIRSVVGYPGVNSPARKNHIIVLVGFEAQRTKLLIDALQFDKISLGIVPKGYAIQSLHQELNDRRHLELMAQYTNAEQFYFTITNPYETEKCIVAQIEKFSEFNTVVAPMNNKLSTIGAGLAAINNSRIQLIYAKPREYNVIGYSEPSNNSVFIIKMKY